MGAGSGASSPRAAIHAKSRNPAAPLRYAAAEPQDLFLTPQSYLLLRCHGVALKARVQQGIGPAPAVSCRETFEAKGKGRA